MTGGRVALIGDVAGHLRELGTELVRLGADPLTHRLPDDLTVIQVGDLIHRGPDSAGVIALVDRYLREQPGQWVQLAGNHEAQYLRPAAFAWPEQLDDVAVGRLRSWWRDGVLGIAAAVSAGDEHFFVSHAGLTEGFWRQALDEPATAGAAAAAVNSFIGTHEDVLFHHGEMLGGGAPDLTAGPVWAGAATELVPSWLARGTALPFSQVHGHSMIVDWRRRAMRADDEVARLVTAVDEVAAHETVTLPGGRIIGIDPGHGRRPWRSWQALVLEGATLG